jgi:hypothetical protein
MVQWHKAPGQTVPVKKWLIDIRPDASSKWAQTFAERLAALALAIPLTVEDNPTGDEDLADDGEGGEAEPASVPAPVPADTPAASERLAEAPAGVPEQTIDFLEPKPANDYSNYWVVAVPKVAEANKSIPGPTLKELAKAAMNESGNDAIRAYDLLRQKVETGRS